MKPSSIILITAFATWVGTGQAQILFTGDYSNNFDGLGATGTSFEPGWAAVRWAGSGPTGESLNLGVTAGSATSGGVFNVGVSGDADRALGVLASGVTVPRFGVQLQNDTGGTVSELDVSGVMEQWRTGSSAASDEVIAFEYSLDAANLNDAGATWVAVTALDLNEKLTASTSAGAVEGNLPENQTAFSTVLSGIDWDQGGVLTLRWTDADATGSDGLYALDQFAVSTVPEPSTWALLTLGATALGVRRLRRR